MRLIPRSWRELIAKPVSVAGNCVTLLHDGEQCYPAMLEAIAAAKHEVLLEMYWFGSDATGQVFADALIERATSGVKVRLIYDAVGSWEASEEIFGRMRDGGVEVHEYNPIAVFRNRFRFWIANRRDHRKILVVDGKLCVTGGVNIGDPWAPISEGGEGWRDDMIQIEGPAATEMRTLFMGTWEEVTSGGGIPTRAFLTKGVPTKRARSHVGIKAPENSSGDGVLVQVLANFYRGERKSIHHAYLNQIRRASERIYISNSYFLPDRAVRRALVAAARRGVDVRVMIPHPSDVVAVHFATRRVLGALINAGVKAYLWEKTVLHCKTAVIDRAWTTVGTYNLDNRSWRFNLEVNVSVADGDVTEAMATRMLADMSESSLLTAEMHQNRPLWQRALENFFYLFRKLL